MDFTEDPQDRKRRKEKKQNKIGTNVNTTLGEDGMISAAGFGPTSDWQHDGREIKDSEDK